MIDRRTFFAAASGAAASLALAPRAGAAPRQLRVAMPDGAHLHVQDWAGSGSPVILTHAWPLSSEIWEAQAAALANAGHRVIAYDRRGFGRSDQPASGYDFDRFADDLAALVSALGIENAALVGHSMGGGEVVRYFSRHGGRGIAKAGFVGAAASYLLRTADNPDGLPADVFAGIKQGVRQDRRGYLTGLLRDVFFDMARPATRMLSAEGLQRWVEVAMQAGLEATIACVDAFNATDFRPELSAVRVPTLVLHGTADIPVPIALGRATARGIAGAELVEYDGVSHGLVLTEQDRVSGDLVRFLGAAR